MICCIDELNAAIRELLVPYNNKISKSASDSRVDLLGLVEIKELQPLPVNRYEMYTFAWATVYKNAYILLGEDKHYYSMPYELTGKKVKVPTMPLLSKSTII